MLLLLAVLIPAALVSTARAACPGPEVINGVNDSDGCADTVFVILRLELRDARAEQPVAGTVTIRGGQARHEQQVAGSFETVLATPGMYTVDVHAAGYTPRTYRLRLSRGTALTLGVALQPE